MMLRHKLAIGGVAIVLAGGVWLGNERETDDTRITDLHKQQEQFLKDKGQYVHIPRTEYSTGKFYEVHEFLYPDKSRGYQIILTEQRVEKQTTSTGTSDVLVETKRSVGVGKEATNLTFTK